MIERTIKKPEEPGPWPVILAMLGIAAAVLGVMATAFRYL